MGTARRVLSVSAAMVAGLGVLTACSGGGGQERSPETSETSRTGSPAPSVTRNVPPPERKQLAQLGPVALCGLVPRDVLARLAFEVREGVPREVSADPAVRGCLFDAAQDDAGQDGTAPETSSEQTSARNAPGRNASVLISAQPAGLEDLGWGEVDLGGVPASKARHANDCTVYAGVRDATLQVTVTSAQAGEEQCDTARDVATYAVRGLVR